MIAIDEYVFDVFEQLFHPILTELHGLSENYQDEWDEVKTIPEVESLLKLARVTASRNFAGKSFVT